MKDSEKQKNIYDLQHQTYLNYLNIFVVGIFGAWITIFFQTSIQFDIKLIITALFINLLIISLFIFNYYSNNLKQKIMSIEKKQKNQTVTFKNTL